MTVLCHFYVYATPTPMPCRREIIPFEKIDHTNAENMCSDGITHNYQIDACALNAWWILSTRLTLSREKPPEKPTMWILLYPYWPGSAHRFVHWGVRIHRINGRWCYQEVRSRNFTLVLTLLVSDMFGHRDAMDSNLFVINIGCIPLDTALICKAYWCWGYRRFNG